MWLVQFAKLILVVVKLLTADINLLNVDMK
jgi:hypothetical protein